MCHSLNCHILFTAKCYLNRYWIQLPRNESNCRAAHDVIKCFTPMHHASCLFCVEKAMWSGIKLPRNESNCRAAHDVIKRFTPIHHAGFFLRRESYMVRHQIAAQEKCIIACWIGQSWHIHARTRCLHSRSVKLLCSEHKSTIRVQ